MAKIEFQEIITMDMEQINREISKIEGILCGNIDHNNLATGLEITTNSVVDCDIYVEGEKFISDGVGAMATAIDKLESKLDSSYDLTVNKATVAWNITKDTFDAQGTISRSKYSYINVDENETVHVKTHIMSVVGEVDKATDYKMKTFGDFFKIIFDNYEYKGYTWDSFRAHVVHVYNIDLDSACYQTEVTFASHAIPIPHFSHGYIQDDTSHVSVETELMMINFDTTPLGDTSYLSLQVDFNFLLGRII